MKCQPSNLSRNAELFHPSFDRHTNVEGPLPGDPARKIDATIRVEAHGFLTSWRTQAPYTSTVPNSRLHANENIPNRLLRHFLSILATLKNLEEDSGPKGNGNYSVLSCRSNVSTFSPPSSSLFLDFHDRCIRLLAFGISPTVSTSENKRRQTPVSRFRFDSSGKFLPYDYGVPTSSPLTTSCCSLQNSIDTR
jgi:hypothetical protein